MARRITANVTLTPVAFADTTGISNGSYPFCLQGGSSTQLTNIWEVSITGQAASTSSPTIMLLAYNSTAGTGAQSQGANGSDIPINPATAALAAPVGTGNTFATAPPQRSSTNKLMNCSLNSFGGSFFWRANRVEECPQMNGNTAPNGTITLSAFTGGTPGLNGQHLIYETY